ncbi:MAG: hypothetical protein ACM3PF_04460 [Bacteroidota bacterium]
MSRDRFMAAGLAGLAVAMLTAGSANGMPMFARRYGVECSSCHTIIPRLNEQGMVFRAAGFRMDPKDIGSEDAEINNISAHTSTRLQSRYDASKTKDPDNPNPARRSFDNSRFTFLEVTFYPLTGAFMNRYASEVELSIGPEEPVEIENAWVRGLMKSGASGWAHLRAGIFHPFEGYGASDRPITIDRPLIQTTAARFNQNTFFTPWGFDEAGVEAGYSMSRTFLRATVFNGLTYDPDEATVHPAQTGASGNAFAKDQDRPDYHNVDFQAFLTHILADDGGGISLYYYKGALALPIGGVPDAGDGYFQDSYYRLAGYGSYPVAKRALLLGGVQYGKDQSYDEALDAYGPKFSSLGYFGEADVDLGNSYWLAGRYDWFDPSRGVDNSTLGNDKDNQIWAATAAINKPLWNGFQYIAQYRHRQTKQGNFTPTREDKKEDAFQFRLIWIW